MRRKSRKSSMTKKHAKPHLFQPGQLVLKKDFTRRKRKGGKLDSKFLGPYTIVKALGNGTYLLAREGRPEEEAQATGAHLKPYTTSDEPSNNPSDEPSSDPPADPPSQSSDPPADPLSYSCNSSDPLAKKKVSNRTHTHTYTC